MLKRKLLSVMLAALLPLLFSNVAMAQEEVAPLTECGEGTQNIDFWHGLTGPDGSFLLDMVNQYNSSNEDAICVTLTVIHWDQFFSKWLSDVGTGNPPDAVLYHINEMPQYASLGAVTPIDDLATEVGIDLADYPEEMQKLSHWNEQLYGIPLDVHPIGMYYNVDMVEAAGLDPANPPTDRETLLDWAQKLTKEDGSQYGLCFASVNVQSFRVWYGWLWQNEARFIDDEGKTVVVNSPEAQETLQFASDLVNEYGVAPEGQQDPDTDFQNGKCAIHFQGPWWITGYANTEGLNFMTAPQPTIFKQPGVWASNHFFGISTQEDTASQLNAMKFIKWMSDNGALWGLSGQIPASQTARESEAFTGSDIYKYQQAFVDEIPYAYLTPVIPESTEIFAENVQTPLVVNFQAAMLGALDAATALAEMQTGVQAVLDRTE
ncbi:MAG: ABC transporter substrate-binding protein [Anaerolineae bacterium]|nr:ABC transporter substrate-binding protein [Anaerolineae bacterium]